MNDPLEIQSKLRRLSEADPFEPFTIHMKSGDYLIPNEESITFLENGDPRILLEYGQWGILNSRWISFLTVNGVVVEM